MPSTTVNMVVSHLSFLLDDVMIDQYFLPQHGHAKGH